MSLGTLIDWLGEGGNPVRQVAAEQRARVCEICPMNRSPKWWERFITNPIAEVMREQMVLKHNMELRVPNEDMLHVCAACGCCLPLKVWTPIEHILKHTTSEQLAKFHPLCWILKEKR